MANPPGERVTQVTVTETRKDGATYDLMIDGKFVQLIKTKYVTDTTKSSRSLIIRKCAWEELLRGYLEDKKRRKAR